MKSKILSIKNIPELPPMINPVNLKPKGVLYMLIVIGFIGLWIAPEAYMVSASIITLSLFGLIVYPDCHVIGVSEEYLVLYNQKNRDFCFLAYWDEILFWSYQRHADKDELIVEMIDHHIEKVSCYSRRKTVQWVQLYAADKEKALRKEKVV
ncbi:MAG: hypothetical protein ACK5LZ_05480 [Anaerorhabdus sp.]